MRSVMFLLTLGASLAVFGGGMNSALAEEDVLLAGETDGLEQYASSAPVFAGAVLDDTALSGQRGGADVHLSEIRAIGTVSEVSASDLVTGHNIVSGGALAGASGMPMFIQNSGNGVLIQNAVIVNVQVQ